MDPVSTTRALSLITNLRLLRSLRLQYTFLTSAFELCDCERTVTLLNLPGLGDSKLSELMDSMLSLLGNHNPCFLFKHIFLQQLPDDVRAPLASSSMTDYRTLAQEADKIYLSGHPQQHHTHEVNSTKAPSPAPHLIDNMCYYQNRFGNKARKCLITCKLYDEFLRNQGHAELGPR